MRSNTVMNNTVMKNPYVPVTVWIWVQSRLLRNGKYEVSFLIEIIN